MQETELQEVEKDRQPNIEQLDVRMRNIEKIAQTIENVTEKGFASANEYLKKKAEQEKLDLELEDRQHKRSIWILGCVILALFTLLMAAMLLKQFELVKIILGSALAVGSGAGITSLFKRKK